MYGHSGFGAELNFDFLAETPEKPLDDKAREAAVEKELSRIGDASRVSGHGEAKLNPKDQKLEQELQAAIDAKDFDIRTGLGSRFMRAHVVGSQRHEAYKAQKSFQSKVNFRIEWAALELKKLQEKKTYSRSYQEVDVEKGQYLPFTCIVREEGADTAAHRAACLYCKKAAAMQGRWTSWNSMTERWEYLCLKRYHVETFKQAWAMHVTYGNEGDANQDRGSGSGAGGSGSGSTPADGKKNVETIAVETKKGTKPPKKGGKSIDDDKEDKGPKEKSCLDKAILAATAVKKDFTIARGQARDIVDAIELGTNEKWGFANNIQNVGKLKSAMSNLETAITDQLRPILICTTAQLRKDVGGDDLTVLCTEFVKVLKPLIADVTTTRSTLLARYRAP